MFRLQIVAIIRELYYYEDTRNVSYVCCILCSDLFNDAVSIAGYTHWNVRLWRITNWSHPVFRRYILGCNDMASGSRRILLYCLTLKMEVLRSLETSGSTPPRSPRHIITEPLMSQYVCPKTPQTQHRSSGFDLHVKLTVRQVRKDASWRPWRHG